MRGSQNFTLLFADEAPAPELKAVPKSGRDAELIESRNRLLLHRYYWHGTRPIENGVTMDFESLIGLLAREFFITNRRITDIIAANARIVKEIRQEHKGNSPEKVARKFANEWPFMRW